MQINFYPEYDTAALITAANEYTEIWQQEGNNILAAFEKISKLTFVETTVNAVVFEGVSYSRPLQLRASNSYEEKKATLVHELAHRISYGNKVKRIDPDEEKKLAAHKVIFLILYDVLVELYGEQFAKSNVEKEQKIGDAYRQAWDYVLEMNKDERAKTFAGLVENK